MDAKIAYYNLERAIDLSKKERLKHISELRLAITHISSCILESRDAGLYLVPRSKELLVNCPVDATVALHTESMVFIDRIQEFCSPGLPDASDIFQAKSASCSVEEGTALLERVMPLLDSEPDISVYNESIAASLSQQERRQFVEYAINCIQTFGQHTDWSTNLIYIHCKIFQVLYSICKYDSLMCLFFHFANNMIDRIPSADFQLTRDFTESVIKIGYAEHMEAEAYLSAARAYTLCHNAVAGLFYLHIAMTSIKQANKKLSKDDVFEILWLMMKIIREMPGYPEHSFNVVVNKFQELHCSDYKVLSFMLTVFSIRLKRGQKHVVTEILDFLNEYREAIMQHMEHSAMQWYSILSAVETIFPDLFNDQLKMYKSTFSANIDVGGNERTLDLIHGENLAQQLFRAIAQLEKTRDSKDYATDNKNALLIANKLLPQAVEQANVEDFILSMRVKTDFTYIFKDTYLKTTTKKLELDEEDADDYETLYRNRKNLLDFLNVDPNDAMLWIGECHSKFYYMSLKGEEYKLGALNGWDNIDVGEVSRCVSDLQYITDAQDSHKCWYVKSVQEFEDENKSFCERFGHQVLPIPSDTQRLLLVKDVEISNLPHQLLSSGNDEYIGEKMPSANVISTEFFILSNMDNNIEADFQPSFWIPLDSGDIALNRLWSHLENEITPFCQNIYTTISIAEPLNNAINIVCAHGAKTIGETDWFFAGDEPIKNVDAIVGKGKLLILLVCHSGSMNPGLYDTAVHSIVKKFIRNGYNALIAPAWSLSTEIVPLWMKTFMNAFVSKTDYVIDAVYQANMAVKARYTAISAWACMHLYGNPYLQINDKPSLTLKMNDTSMPI